MKIYILKTPEKTRPQSQKFKYPKHNADYGVEQDFLKFLDSNKELLTDSPNEADWHFLPIYWTRWHLNHQYGAVGLEELQSYVDNSILNSLRTFTICQYDDGPLVDLGETIQFLASRKTHKGIDIPLLCKNHKRPWLAQKKKYLASFLGRISTHSIRGEMIKHLGEQEGIFIRDGSSSTSKYVKLILQSYLVLAPRGYGGSSFRLFEAMQLGVAPVLISDLDTRPFKKFLPWESATIYGNNLSELKQCIAQKTYADMLSMGKNASDMYENSLVFQKWCPYVLKELESVTK